MTSRPVPRARRARRAQRGQIIVFFALAFILVLAMMSVAIDGGYQMSQYRRAQNAADFAAVAGTRTLQGLCENGANPPTDNYISSVMQDVIDQNSPSVGTAGTGWTATYIDQNGRATGHILGNPAATWQVTPWNQTASSSDYPPVWACGVQINVTATWNSYFAHLIGFNQMQTQAGATAVDTRPTGAGVGIVSMDQVGPHVILGGGSGQFVVYGNIFSNSNASGSPWVSTQHGQRFTDTVDAKDGSMLQIYGSMESVAYQPSSLQWPLDWCFGHAGIPNNSAPSAGYRTAANSYPVDTDPTTYPAPYHQPPCSVGTVDVGYDQILSATQLTQDPIQCPGGNCAAGLPDPLANNTIALCPGQSTAPVYDRAAFNSMMTSTSTPDTLLPGSYNFPVLITSTTHLADCSGHLDTAMNQYPGIFRFPDGLWVELGPGQTLDGYNVMLATGNSFAMPGNVPGNWNNSNCNATQDFCPPAAPPHMSAFHRQTTGNGGPCYLPADGDVTGGNYGSAIISVCSGTGGSGNPFPQLDGVQMQQFYGSTSHLAGTGTNFSLMLGGSSSSSIDIQAPQYGQYQGVIAFQQRGNQANYGFDAESQDPVAPFSGADAASISLTGVIYNTTLPNMGSGQPLNVYDFSGGIPVRSGGLMQTGFGTGSGSTSLPPSAGSVTIYGMCVVDDFNTDGNSNIAIYGIPYNLPGSGGGPSLIS